MTQAQRLRALTDENAALRAKLKAQVALDVEFKNLRNAVLAAVCANLQHITQDDRERVLLAAAVSYGIIKPITPRKRKAAAPPEPASS